MPHPSLNEMKENNRRYKAERLSELAGSHNRNAVKALAMSAALEERLAELENPSSSGVPAMLWFACRSLCAEFGVNYEALVESARHYARNV